MANEIEKTIEELEAEVLSELEEQSADAPKKGAAPAEPALKASDASSVTPGGEVQDMGPAVTSPTQASGPGTQAGKKAKEASGDAAQKKEGKPDSMDTPNDGEKKVAKSLAAGDEVEMKDDQETISEKEQTDEGMHDDKKEGMHGEMSKMEMIKAMKDMETEMKEMDKKMVMSMYNKMKEMMAKEMSHEESEKEALKKEAVEQRIKEINVQEHVEALMSGEGDLSDDFKKKAATVFESAVKSKVRDEVTRLQENYDNELEEATKSVKADLTEKVDTYLNYVVEEWMKENELALERGLKGEIAEDFISGLKTLFEDHYIDVPNEKYDVLEDQADKISKLEKKLEETIQQVVEAKESNSSLIKQKVMNDVSSDLTDTEIEKFQTLAQDVEYSNEEGYAEKLNTIKESYFPRQKTETKN